MTLNERIDALIQLGCSIEKKLNDDEDIFKGILQKACYENSWFDPAHSRLALKQVREMLTGENLRNWINRYEESCFNPGKPLRIGVVMAGNLPLVGFHDMLCVLITGHVFLGKWSAEDRVLWQFLTDELQRINPDFGNRISLKDDLKDGFDAVIATGSNNTSRYFEYYFGRFPHIIRHHRNSLAILSGNESDEQLDALTDDICLYYGRGCRSVSKLFVPRHYAFEKLINALQKYNCFANHHKYFSNYEYNKALMLINKVPFRDTGFMLLAENDALASPVSVLHYSFYNNQDDIQRSITRCENNLQCVAGPENLWKDAIPFGHTQKPRLYDYADGVDTIEFLSKIIS